MPYSDLLADAIIYFPLDNSKTPIVKPGWEPQVEQTYAPVFEQDAPPVTGNSHSFAMCASNSCYYSEFGNDLSGQEMSMSFWVKIKTLVPVEQLPTTSMTSPFVFRQPTVLSSINHMIIYGSNYNPAIYNGIDRKIGTSFYGSGATGNLTGKSYNSNPKLNYNQWHHIAFNIRNNAAGSEMSVWVDGTCANFQFDNGFDYPRLSWRDVQFPYHASVNPNLEYLISNAAFFNRTLTKEEIREQAWYGHTTEDYIGAVNQDNPTYFALLDNPDKNTDHTVYGATHWGTFPDEPNVITVNEPGPFGNKAWTFGLDSIAANTVTTTTDPEMLNELANLYKSGSFSIEFWNKQDSIPGGTRKLFGTYGNNVDVNSVGGLSFEMDNSARYNLRAGYKSSATAYTQGSILATQIDTPNMNQTDYILHPGSVGAGFGDNTWHHVVYTFDISDNSVGTGTFGGFVYVDGCRVGYRSFTNTYGWVDGAGDLPTVSMGSESNSQLLGNNSIAAIAMYPYRLSEEQIRNHFKIGYDYIAGEGLGEIKYYDGNAWQTSTTQKIYDGTNWIDWNAKYYDGTNWVVV